MQRITVTLEDEQAAALVALSRSSGELSVSALTRMAVAFLLKNPALFLPPAHTQIMHNAEAQPAGASA